jgi:trimethylamine--corrinoid protein Co-methyltransferase
MFALSTVPASGAQYIHYAFGLLERTNVFCPEQAILDDAHIDLVKKTLQDPRVRQEHRPQVLSLIREVMASADKSYMYYVPLPSRDPVYARFPLEDEEGGALAAAHRRYHELLQRPRKRLPAEVRSGILRDVPGVMGEALPDYEEDVT